MTREEAERIGADYYHERGNVVFTAKFLLERGRCCGCGCRHCPYESEPVRVLAAAVPGEAAAPATA